jgi:hypothetical protein
MNCLRDMVESQFYMRTPFLRLRGNLHQYVPKDESRMFTETSRVAKNTALSFSLGLSINIVMRGIYASRLSLLSCLS